jgi:hypothetical protein
VRHLVGEVGLERAAVRHRHGQPQLHLGVAGACLARAARCCADGEQLALRSDARLETGDRDLIERLLAEDFVFSSPPDPLLSRDEYFERCWPNADLIVSYDVVRMVETGDEVIVTYESTKSNGKRFRNTEVLTFSGDEITRAEVYFGWDLPSP